MKSGVRSPLFFIATLFFVFSFINPNHRWPWTSFHSELFSITGLTLIALAGVDKNIYLNKFHFLCAAFCFSILFCYFSGINYFRVNIVIGLLYVTLACMAFSIGNIFKENLELLDLFFCSLLISFIISFSFQILQYFEFHFYYDPWVLNPNDSRRYSGNIGQPNHLASLAVTSLILSIYLFLKRQVASNIVFLISLFVGISLQLTGSRTGLLSLFFILIVLFFLKNLRSNIKYLLLAIFSYIAFSFFNIDESRDYLEGSISAGRFEIWSMLLKSIFLSPWVGYGFNETIEANFAMLENSSNLHGITAHAHNIFLDLIVWFGLPVGLLLIIFMVLFFKDYYFSRCDSISKILKISTIPLVIHAMLEFPLHYAYFLIPFFIIVGSSTDNGFFKKKVNSFKILFFSLILLSSFLVKEYFFLEQLISEQRFFLSNFEKAEKQKYYFSWFLDAQSMQYNYLTKSDSEMSEDDLVNLIKIYPTLKNFYSICFYFKSRDEEKFNFYRKKGNSYLKGEELIFFEKAFPSNF